MFTQPVVWVIASIAAVLLWLTFYTWYHHTSRKWWQLLTVFALYSGILFTMFAAESNEYKSAMVGCVVIIITLLVTWPDELRNPTKCNLVE